MFKHSLMGVSALTFAYMESVKTIIENNTIEEISATDVQFINKNGDIYIPYSDVYTPDHGFPYFAPAQDKEKRLEHREYFQDFRANWISQEITTVEYDKSVPLLALLQQLAMEKTTYGVILEGLGDNREFKVNPLHPMVAFLITAGLLKLPDDGKLHVYEWKNSLQSEIDARMNIPEEVEGYKKDYETFFEIAPNIIKNPVKISQKGSIRDTEIEALMEEPFAEKIRTKINVTKRSIDSKGINQIKSVIIPNQLISDGVIYPYYGISCIKNPSSSNLRGYAVGPMATGNISLSSNDDRSFKSWTMSGSEQNVCAGDASPAVPRGWFNLSRVNLESMYYSNVIATKYVFPFIQASKEIAADIYGVAVEEQKQELEEVV